MPGTPSDSDPAAESRRVATAALSLAQWRVDGAAALGLSRRISEFRTDVPQLARSRFLTVRGQGAQDRAAAAVVGYFDDARSV